MAIWNLDTFTSWCRIFMQPITQLRSQKQIGQKVFQIQIRGVQRWPFTFARETHHTSWSLAGMYSKLMKSGKGFYNKIRITRLFSGSRLMEVLQNWCKKHQDWALMILWLMLEKVLPWQWPFTEWLRQMLSSCLVPRCQCQWHWLGINLPSFFQIAMREPRCHIGYGHLAVFLQAMLQLRPQPEHHHYWLRQQLLLLCQQLGNCSRKRNRIASCPKVVRMALGISWKGSYPAWPWHLFLAWNMYTNLSLRCSMWEIPAKWQLFSKSFLDLGLNSQASRHTCENST